LAEALHWAQPDCNGKNMTGKASCKLLKELSLMKYFTKNIIDASGDVD
jgi:hypothetical protein